MAIFGCCSSFEKCSDNKACIYPNDKRFEDCFYRRHLEAGRIFYGKNANKNKNCEGDKKTMEIKVLIESPELVKALNNLADAISGNKSSGEAAQKPTNEKKSSKAAKEPTLETKPEVNETPAPDSNQNAPEPDPLLSEGEEKTFTLEEVRAALTELTRNGKSAEMRQLINSYGVDKLSDIPADQYSDLMEKVAKLK